MTKDQKRSITGAILIIAACVIAFAIAALLSGCAATQKQLAKNLEQKSIMGDGILTVNQVTVTDPASESFTPELKSIFISGKFLSLLKNATFLAYDKKSTASTFNASAVTSTESLVIQTQKSGDLANVLKAVTELTKKTESAKE